MAKVNTASIEGYADMTPEQKVAALEALDLPEADYSGMVKKEVFDRTASELSAAKKQLRESLSDAEREKADRDEELQSLRSQVETLKTEREIDDIKAQCLALGFSAEQAEAGAKSYHGGDKKQFFATLTTWLEEHDKAVKADLIKGSAVPPAGSGNKAYTHEEFRKLSAADRVRFAAEHPEEYKQIYGG